MSFQPPGARSRDNAGSSLLVDISGPLPYELGPVSWGEVSESVEGARLETV